SASPPSLALPLRGPLHRRLLRRALPALPRLARRRRSRGPRPLPRALPPPVRSPAVLHGAALRANGPLPSSLPRLAPLRPRAALAPIRRGAVRGRLLRSARALVRDGRPRRPRLRDVPPHAHAHWRAVGPAPPRQRDGRLQPRGLSRIRPRPRGRSVGRGPRRL